MATKFLKKLTLKNAGIPGAKAEAVAVAMSKENPNAETPVFRVYGKLGLSPKLGSSNFGPYVEFNGEFEAINLIDNQVYRSKNLIVPEVAEMAINGLISDCVQGKDENEKKLTKLRFGLDVTVIHKPVKEGQKGFEFKFGVQPLTEPKGDDELTLIAKEFGKPPLLTGPKEEPKDDTKKGKK
jgi:hypothetical protein